MFNNHPALAVIQQRQLALGADPYLRLSLLASDYVAHRVQTDKQLSGIFCHDQLHHKLTGQMLDKLADKHIPPQARRLAAMPCAEAARQLAEGATIESQQALFIGLRKLRQEAMLRIIGRMACGIASQVQTMREVSLLAELCINLAASLSQRQLAARHGLPRDAEGQVIDLLIMGMGKLGGQELNLSSDVDLIFVQSGTGETRPFGEGRALGAGQFFQRVGRQIIAMLDQVTADGFVFRIDMRLRPYGDSGALVCRLTELDNYYYEQARVWERFALTRARVICGSTGRAELERMIEAFVYRRHIDFGVLDHLRELHASIQLMAQRQQADNIKIGRGGIREVEFFAQAMQLIYGGVYPQLRQRSTLASLAALADVQLLLSSRSQQLSQAYVWLRDLENRLQALNDTQTQRMPTDHDSLERIAAGMGLDSIDVLQQQLEHNRELVHQAFSQLLNQHQEEKTSKLKVDQKLEQLSADLFAGNSVQLLKTCPDLAESREQIESFFARAASLSESIQACLRAVMGRLLRSIFDSPRPGEVGPQVFALLEGIIRRPVYLSLLRENPKIIHWLVVAMANSKWVARQLIEHPLLLGCFVEGKTTWKQPQRSAILQQLHLQLFSLPERDVEQEMDALRHFALARRMQVALAQLEQSLSLMQVSDYLSLTAEACIDQACRMAWRQLGERHGMPGENDLSGLAVIAYGKLGGLELSYASDLDLVFAYALPGERMTNGPRPISYAQFYQRLAQLVIHLLSAPTRVGFAYAVDARLRPNGKDGMMACSLSAWRDYYLTSAWTWEYQALVRARPICGSPNAIGECSKIREELLCTTRNPVELANQVSAMRERIAATHPSKGIKYGRGGLVDIEFIVQYLALAHAAQHRQIIHHPDNLRILQELAKAGVLDEQDAAALRQSYLELRNLSHYEYLEVDQLALEPDNPQAGARLWHKLLTQQQAKA